MGTATFILALVTLFQVVHGYKHEEQSVIVTVYSLEDDKSSKNDLLMLLSKILYNSHSNENAERESPKKEVVLKPYKDQDNVSKNLTHWDKVCSGENVCHGGNPCHCNKTCHEDIFCHGEKPCHWNKAYHEENLCQMEKPCHGNKPGHQERFYSGDRFYSPCNTNCWNCFPRTCNNWNCDPCSCNCFPNNYCNWYNWSPWNGNICFSTQGNVCYWSQPCYPVNSDENGIWSYCPYCGRWSYTTFNNPVMSINNASNNCTICSNADINSPDTNSDLLTPSVSFQ